MTRNLDARLSRDQVVTLYDRLAPIYDLWGVLAESRARRRALELAAIYNGEAVLEVAVGTGLTFCQIVQRNPDGVNVGLDLSPGMLAKARKRLTGIVAARYTLGTGDALDLGLEDNTFDLLVNAYMFDLIPFDRMDRILDEFRRVLKPGGRLVLVNMARREDGSSCLYQRLYALSPRLMGGCRGVAMAERVAGHGFRVDALEFVRQMGFPSEVIRAVRDSTP